jgi:hypothetical protein
VAPKRAAAPIKPLPSVSPSVAPANGKISPVNSLAPKPSVSLAARCICGATYPADDCLFCRRCGARRQPQEKSAGVDLRRLDAAKNPHFGIKTEGRRPQSAPAVAPSS